MAIQKPQFDQYALDSLKRKLSDKLGFVIASKPDCAKLALLISQSGAGYISESTLYRIFFHNYKKSAYKSTLDLLCKFLGFIDCFDFLERINVTRGMLHHNGVSATDGAHKSLLYHCIEHGSFKPLSSFFDSIDGAPHQFKMGVMVSLFDSLLESKNQKKFMQHFAHQKYVREYFFELGHDPKFRIKDYDLGYQIYLKGVDKSKSIAQLQEYVFGNCVLFRHFFISNEEQKALSHGKHLYEELPTLEQYQKDLHCFPFIRYTAYKLWFLQLSMAAQGLQNDYGRFLLGFCKSNKSALNPFEQRMLFHTIAEVFVHSNLSESFHRNLKKIFKNEFEKFPQYVAQRHLRYSLPYFEPNGMLHIRP